jgi:hypothetical protein
MRRIAVVAAVLLVSAGAGAAPGSAQEPDAGESRAGSFTSGVARSTTLGSCKTVTAWRGFRLFFLQTYAWKYFERISWCYNGRRLTSFTYRRWPEVYVPTWDFKGHIGFQASGGEGSRSARRWTQGKFRQCAAWCFQTKTPWVDLLVRRDGSWSYATGG